MSSKNRKYNLKSEQIKQVFATADMQLTGDYDNRYKKFIKQGSNGNFHCPNSEAHGRGTDVHASMSVNIKTGQYKCHTCGIKGNFNTFFKEYIAGTGNYGDSYLDFIIDELGLTGMIGTPEEWTQDYEKKSEEMFRVIEGLRESYKKKNGVEFTMSKDMDDARKETTYLDKNILTEYNNNLLGHADAMKYLWEKRHINANVVKKYSLGLTKDPYGERIVFPMIDAEGNLVNIKTYDPFASKEFKWKYPHKDLGTIPTPMNNFIGQKIYFFEGEPDCYCAIGYGLNGVTLGPAAATDVVGIFGIETVKMLFTGKEIVICFDSDDAGRVGAQKLAHNLYPYAKQIKILDLDKRDGVPYGLPLDTKEIEEKGKKKTKRVFKDFSDFMVVVNGNSENALKNFSEIEYNTTVYTENDDRARVELFKVTLQECRQPKYSSHDGTIELEVLASVSQFDSRAYLYPNKVKCECPAMSDRTKQTGSCKRCKLKDRPGYGTVEEMSFSLVRTIPLADRDNDFVVRMSEHDILGLIKVTEYQKDKHLRKTIGISGKCEDVSLFEIERDKLIEITLVRDINETRSTDVGSTEIDVQGYMLGERDIYPNQTYRFRGVQTTQWDKQNAVLFLHSAEPIMSSVESFRVTEDVKGVLRALQPIDGDTVEGQREHLKRRYDVLGNILGISGRSDLIYLNDLAFFSAAEIKNTKLLPQVTRGFVEILIPGDTRCGKTVVSHGLHMHYGVGDMISGSSATSRSGILGGIATNDKTGQATIAWGKIPMYDRSIIIIDELGNLKPDTIDALTACRSSGVVEINMIISRKAPGRTRKIMLSNSRDPSAQISDNRSLDGMSLMLNVCINKAEVLSRFDAAMIVKRDDVPYDEFHSSYDQIFTDFTVYQCHMHVLFAHSRLAEHITFEDGIEEHISAAQALLLKKYHPSTQLVNQEMRAKLVRLSTAHAILMLSTEDFEHVIVKKSHVDFVTQKLDEIYSSKNMHLDSYSQVQRRSEELGNMDFMMNILKYVSIFQVIQMDDMNEMAVLHVFHDYIMRVVGGTLSIVDAMSDDRKESGNGVRSMDVTHKLVSVLVARNCFVRVKGRYRKSSMFNQWLKERLEQGKNAKSSDILEHIANKSVDPFDESIRKYNVINTQHPNEKKGPGMAGMEGKTS